MFDGLLAWRSKGLPYAVAQSGTGSQPGDVIDHHHVLVADAVDAVGQKRRIVGKDNRAVRLVDAQPVDDAGTQRINSEHDDDGVHTAVQRLWAMAQLGGCPLCEDDAIGQGRLPVPRSPRSPARRRPQTGVWRHPTWLSALPSAGESSTSRTRAWDEHRPATP